MDSTTKEYFVKRLVESDLINSKSLLQFIVDTGAKLNGTYGDKYDWNNFPIMAYIRDHYFAICYRGDEPVGLAVGTLTGSQFDANVKILRQTTMFALPSTRAAHYLMRDFIDFGKVNANHTITTINSGTNIKPSSLEKLGFKKSETLYRMEN